METTITGREAAIRLGTVLRDHKALDVRIMDLTGRNTWADFFVLATVTSSAHSRGLQRHILEVIPELDLEIHRTRNKMPDGEEWHLIDLGPIVVHLMSATARSFYDLEKLWFDSVPVDF